MAKSKIGDPCSSSAYTDIILINLIGNCGEKADKPCCSKHKLEGKKLDTLSSKPDTKKGDKKGGDKPERKDDGKLDPGKLDKPKK